MRALQRSGRGLSTAGLMAATAAPPPRRRTRPAARLRRGSVGIRCVLRRAAPRAAPAPGARAPQAVAPRRCSAAIDKLGDLDYATRTAASRTVRRAAAEQAVPALCRPSPATPTATCAIARWCCSTGFNDPRTRDAMREAHRRVRTIGCARSPTASSSTTPIARWRRRCSPALEKEQAEFVRPGAGPRAGGARRRPATVQARAARGRRPRRGFLPQRGDRGARRLTRRHTRSTR